jgi:hypothetical protein
VSENLNEQDGHPEDGMSRRSVLKKGAMVVGGAAFAVPAIQTISMSRAAAQSPSGGGGGGGGGGPAGSDPSHGYHHNPGHHKPWW